MNKIPKMVDMARSTEEKVESMMPTITQMSDYDYGLGICLNNESLQKLGLDTSDVEVGDYLHIHGLAKVTSVSSRSTDSGDDCRIELTITHLATESEDEENEEEESEPLMKKLYKKK